MAKNKKILSIVATGVLSTSLMLAGCGAAKQGEPGAGGAADGKKLRIAMVTDVGGVNDNSFNQSAWEGLQRAQKDLGIDAKYQESHSAEDYQPNLNSFVKANYDLTWGIGYAMAKDLTTVAQQNPNAKLAIVDSNLDGKIPSNVEAVTFKEQEGSFLMGVIAGLMTKSNKVGFIGGVQVPLIEKFEYGFRAGVHAVNPKATVSVAYAGAFNASDKGKVLAATMYDQGVDVIFPAAGATGDGVFKEAKERGAGKWVIGVDRDQSYLAPDNTLSSMVKHVDVAVYTVAKDLKAGKWNGGHELTLGLKDDGVGYAPTTNKHVPADVLKKVDDFKQKIINGEIKVPSTKAEFDAFVAGK
ncbi:BMP family ABC transporter substrate-binding protein [Collibacillus ludicampi]|uniref:BMP family ABC transporter substrate-binding protein n=1 Tax=Collibacillus ludicampi TaxID=2771369 RepID=A0AAV4LJB6_9BACL|nr:BMP family ABC transporter substrate-binding protein [Collibacillus ludicampi]GIM47865.1 BMP family ABC transporter substrate-binding protein [Collibacillus ludicampi]